MNDELLFNFRINLNLTRLFNGITKIRDPLDYNTVANATRNEVGYEGERSFNSYLLSVLDKDLCKVTWVNEIKESGKPYDFIVTLGNLHEYYIDVKSTKGSYDSSIYMTPRELDFSKGLGDKYYIARLYEGESDKGKFRAGAFNVKIVTVKDILSLLKINT